MTIFIMNSDQKINPSKPINNDTDQNLIIVKKNNGVIVAVRGSQGDYFGFGEIGDTSRITIDTGLGHRDGGAGRIIGFVTPTSIKGEIPTKQVPVYVFK